jgi:tetratricopeptide (TPR) repeat protein
MRVVEHFSGNARFTIERTLGEGGMGVVYLAYDRQQRREVALKTLSRVEPKEFRALSGVSHHNLVVLYELFSESELWFFTMEYVQGTDFLSHVCDGSALGVLEASPTEPLGSGAFERVTECGGEPVARPRPTPMHSETRLRETLRQLAHGISALHVAGKLHKDIKPSNVLVTPEGRVVLLDFGMIDDRGERIDATLESKVFGTPAYMSPEQAAGERIDASSDWYSFGVMLYEALTGRLPFDGHVMDILLRKQREQPPLPSSLTLGVPSGLEALCVRLLSRDPALRPSSSQVLQALSTPSSAPIDPGATRALSTAGFVGRQAELARLREAFAQSRQGQPGVVLVSGRSGIGKSALVRCFSEELANSGQAVVLAGRCYERESLPFKAIDSVIDALCRFMVHLPDRDAARLLPRNAHALARLFPVLRQIEVFQRARFRLREVPDPQELRRRGFAALKELITRLTDDRPVVFCIDDAQWGDDESALLLDALLRPPDAPPMLVVCCHRQDPPHGPVVDQLLASTAFVTVRRIELEALSANEAAQLVQDELRALGAGAASESEARSLAAEAAGSPFFIGQLALAWEREAAARIPRPPLSLEQVLHERIALLPASARRLLEVAAVAGRPMEQGLALEAASSGERGLPDIDVLRAAHFVRTHGPRERDSLECYHDRVRTAVLVQLTPEQLNLHHLRVGEVLEHSGRFAPEALAQHFAQAGDRRRALVYGLQAADAAAEALAFDRAAALYRRVCELGVLSGAALADVEAKLGEVLANAGRSAESASAYLRAASGVEERVRFERERMAAEHFLRSGHVEEGLALLRTVLARIELSLPKTPQHALLALLTRRVRLLLRGTRYQERSAEALSPDQLSRLDTCWSAAVGLGLIDFVRGSDFQTRHLLLALEAGEPYRLARAFALEAGYLAAEGPKTAARVVRTVELAEAILQRHPHPHAQALTFLARAMGAWHLGRWQQTLPLCDEAERIFRDDCKGVAWEIATTHVFEATALYYLGEWKLLGEQCVLHLREAIERGDLYAASDLQTGVNLVPQLASHDVATARAVLAEEKARWSTAGFHLQHWNQLLAENLIDFYDGRGVDAHARVLKTWPALTRSLVLNVHVIGIEALCLRACSALAAALDAPQRRTALLREATRDARRIAKAGQPWSDPLAALLLGLCAQQALDPESAAAQLRAAAAGFDAAQMKLHAAAARYRLGQVVGGDEGRRLTAAATSLALMQGAHHPQDMLSILAPGPS